MGRLCGSDFARRTNPNGTTDSICLKCFRTIATETGEASLASKETAHECFGLDVGGLLHPDMFRDLAENH
jgi:hypothetical protein